MMNNVININVKKIMMHEMLNMLNTHIEKIIHTFYSNITLHEMSNENKHLYEREEKHLEILN